MNFTYYLQNLQNNLEKGSERTHYPTLKNLMDNASLGIEAIIEETGNQAGIPDFTVRKNNQLLGYIEAKKLGEDLDKIEQTEQLQRYFESSIGENLILTNYLEFRWYLSGKRQLTGYLGRFRKEQIIIEASFRELEDLLKAFLNYQGKVINNYEDLAQQMANDTKAIRYSIQEALKIETEEEELTQLKLLFQDLLLPDLDNNKFADIYAQTIAYGLFTARFNHSQQPKNLQFNRQTAGVYIGDKIPFLKGLFSTIIATDAVNKITWVVDKLVEFLAQVDMGNILENFGQKTRREDPVVHFYETFLGAYEASLRKSRGVYYTPEPVVQFMVKAVNDILDKTFDLDDGLGSRKVTILDPATGTGTFLYEVILQIYRNFERYGLKNWSQLLRDKRVLSRLYGFEILMTPYTIAHLKLGLLLDNLGYQFEEGERLNIFLTNTLEEGVKKSQRLEIFSQYISEEANHAAEVKTEIPILVVLGNPPYSVSSQNESKRTRILDKDTRYLADIQPNGQEGIKIYKTGKAGKKITELTYIGELLETYKGRVRLEGERNIQPLDDDYIKFIRFAQDQVEKTGHGIISFITNHSYLNGLIHRGMRESLLQYFDSLYIIDLHGNSLLKETTPEGGVDQNVFDIQQGVAILIAVREKSYPDAFSTVYKKRDGVKLPAEVFYYDLWGKREDKYKFLSEMTLDSIHWVKLSPVSPNLFFSPKDFDLSDEYLKGWSVTDIFPVNSSGIKTHRDHFVIDFNKSVLNKRIEDFCNLNIDQNLIETQYNLSSSSHWDIEKARLEVSKIDIQSLIYPILYRVFDKRYIFFSEVCCERLRKEVMNALQLENIALIVCRQQKELGFQHCFITDCVGDGNTISLNSREYNYYFPLYIYPDTENEQTNLFQEKTPNFSPKFLTAIKEKLGYIPTPETIFYYIYAIFHSPTYRQRYAEFLKIDFPRVPLTSNDHLFKQLGKIGETLVNLHLMKSPLLDTLMTEYHERDQSERQITQITYNENSQTVSINKSAYFIGIPEKVWNFKIGGYQVLDKWLKDRKKANYSLTDEDILHYQKIVVALSKTIELMTEIDKIIPSFPIE